MRHGGLRCKGINPSSLQCSCDTVSVMRALFHVFCLPKLGTLIIFMLFCNIGLYDTMTLINNQLLYAQEAIVVYFVVDGVTYSVTGHVGNRPDDRIKLPDGRYFQKTGAGSNSEEITVEETERTGGGLVFEAGQL